jgi:hypothetical protein
MEETEENEGMSTGKKVAAGAAIGLAVPAAVGVARKVLGDGDDGGQSRRSSSGTRSRSSSGTKSRTGTPRSRARSSSAKRSTGARRRTTARSSSGGSSRTKEQLYSQAKRLKIKGRSSMTKAQLQRAISRTRS